MRVNTHYISDIKGRGCDMTYTLVDNDGDEVMKGNDRELGNMVNYVYQHDGAYILDEKGDIVDC